MAQPALPPSAGAAWPGCVAGSTGSPACWRDQVQPPVDLTGSFPAGTHGRRASRVVAQVIVMCSGGRDVHMPCLDRAGRAMPGSTNARICPASDGPALFLSLKGRRLSARAINLAVRHLGQEADVGTSAHTLRHTCLTRLVWAGNDIVWSPSSPATPGSRPPAATAGPATRTDRQPWTASTPTTDCRQTAALSGGSCAVATYTPTGGWTLPGVSPSRKRGRDPQQRDRVTDFQVGGAVCTSAL